MPSRRLPWLLVPLLLAVPCAGAGDRPAPPARAFTLEPVRSERPPFLLYRPAGWRVTPVQADGLLRITVADPEGVSAVEVAWQANPRRLDSPALLGEVLRDLRRGHPGLSVEQAGLCRDGTSCATAAVAYQVRGAAVRGRLYVHAGPQLAVVRGWRGRADRLQAERPMLLEVLTNLHVLPPRAAPVAPLARRSAPDGSLAVSLPAGWQLQAGQGKAVAVEPGGGAGFMFTAFQIQPPGLGPPGPGVLHAAWQPPEQLVQVIWRQFGNRDVRVLHAEPDGATAAACPRYLGRPCDAADVQLTWTSPQGQACTGAFKLLDARPGPMGQWFSVVAGIWGPTATLDERLPTLEAVAASFSISDQYARGYLQQGAARLRDLQARTRRDLGGLSQAIADNQRDWERRSDEKAGADARWDDYARGNSYWISDLEGGKAYQSDPWGVQDLTTGDRAEGGGFRYLRFEGENPRHPSEHMREVSSHELKKLLEGG